jgi:peptide-methionine (S)-S-oxide reductase
MMRDLFFCFALGATAVVAINYSPSASNYIPIGLFSTSAEARAVKIAAPTRATKESGRSAVAILAGGCFWGLEGVFERVNGVSAVTSGYAGGLAKDATYDAVSSEKTGHAEAVRITYDPTRISYGQLLQIYFSVAHDPTQLNRQGPDTGTSYRSAIFPQNAEQRATAAAYITQLGKAKSFGRPIVTKLESGSFYAAEDYHQDFMRKNPKHGYILAWDVPKVKALAATFPNLVK